MAQPAPSSPSDPEPAPGIPEIRIRKGSSDPSVDENHFEKSGSDSPDASLPAVDEDSVSKDGGDDVFGSDPYAQGYGQLADGDSPFGIKLEHPGVHEPAGVAEEDAVSRVTDPDAPSPVPTDNHSGEVSMEVDGDDDDDNNGDDGDDGDEAVAANSGSYQQMMDVDQDNATADRVNSPEVVPTGAASGPESGGFDSLDTPGSTGPQSLSSPVHDFESLDTGSRGAHSDTESTDDTLQVGARKGPPRPPGSPVAPRRPMSPAAGAGRRSVSPARPDHPPRSRSPARPRSPIARSKSPARPPPPRSPQTVGAEGTADKKVPPARPPSRPPLPGIKKAPAPNPAEFEQEESELVEINANTQEEKEADVLSPASVGGGDVSDASTGNTALETAGAVRDRPRSITPVAKTSLQDYAAADGVAKPDGGGDGRIKITLPKHQRKKRSKSPRKALPAGPEVAAVEPAPKWTTFEDATPLPLDEEDTEEEPETPSTDLGSEQEDEPDVSSIPEKKKPPPRPSAPPANAPNRPPPPSAAARRAVGSSKDAEVKQPAPVKTKVHKEKKSMTKKIMGIGKSKKKHKDEDEFEDFIKQTSDAVPPLEKSEAFAEFEAMQLKSAGLVLDAQGKLDHLGKEVDSTIAYIESTNSPWTVMIGGAPGEEKHPKDHLSSPIEEGLGRSHVKAGWEGFGDDSFSAMSGETAQKLAGLATPVPVPPNNSRRNSGAGDGTDLLGLLAGSAPEVAAKSDAMNTDLLGLLGGDDLAGEAPATMADMLSLSRNPLESAVSSGTSTPNHSMQDPYLDEFLGLSANKDKAFGEGNPFSCDAGKTEQEEEVVEEVPVDPMSLLLAPHTEDEDPFALPPEVDAIAAGENITEAPEPEKETTGDDFLNMAVLVAKEAENEKKDRDPDDFGGFGTPIISDERKVQTIRTESKKSGKSVVIKAVARPRPKKQVELASFLPPPPQKAEISAENNLLMISPGSDEFDPRGDFDAEVRPMPDNAQSIWASGQLKGENPFKADVDAKLEAHKATTNPFLNTDASEPATGEETKGEEADAEEGEAKKEDGPHDEFDIFGPVEPSSDFNPFATIVPDDDAQPADTFDPFATIQGDDAFVDIKRGDSTKRKGEGGEAEVEGEKELTSPRVNPFDKEPPLDEKFASFEPHIKAQDEANEPMFQAFEEQVEEEEHLEPLPPYREPFTGDGWHLFLRQPAKKKLTSNRYWKAVYVRLVIHRDTPTVRVFNNDKDAEIFHELPLQPCYQMCDMGLQQYDQYGKCHTVKIQYVFYRERVGMKADRITPTLGDIARVRDLKGLKNLVHKPKATMILDHAPQASELLKFGSLDYDVFRSFVWTLEDAFFKIIANREIKSQNYTKDEITIDIVDEYYLDIDTMCHITFHKARVRVFCLAFLTGNPTVELGMNDRRRKGKEIVGRKDIIPIRTDEWIRMEDPVFQNTVDQTEYEKSKVIKFIPLDACHFELMRFRTRPRKNRELPLQIRVQQSLEGNHMELRADVIIPGYHSNSRRSQQTPCEDISIVFPIPEPWVYMFRVEKRFKYGSVKAATRKPGKIKGLERLTQMAQGLMPPALIEVSSGGAKYENVFHGIVWRIARLPERNEGAYKQHFFKLHVDLGPHDVMPDTFEEYVAVQFQMPNSMVSRAQARSIGVSDVEDPPDRWVHHLAKYEYTIQIENVQKTRTTAPEVLSSIEDPKTPDSDEDSDDADADMDNTGPPTKPIAPPGVEDSDTSSSDDD